MSKIGKKDCKKRIRVGIEECGSLTTIESGKSVERLHNPKNHMEKWGVVF